MYYRVYHSTAATEKRIVRFNRKSLTSWYIFSRSALNIIFASLCVRLKLKSRKKDQITLFSHLYNGNIKALHQYLCKHQSTASYWASSAPGQTEENSNYLSAFYFRDALKICASAAIVSDHGPGVLKYLHSIRPDCKFIDVWHGVGFKDVSESYQSIHKNYDLLLSPSQWYSETFLISKCGFKKGQISTSGYCLLDQLLENTSPTLPPQLAGYKSYILYAPTWHHDNPNRQRHAFEPQFVLEQLNDIALKHNTAIIYRAHLNDLSSKQSYSNVISLSMAEYPDTVQLLKIADCLISDWSSISVDYNSLQRPIYHLDSKPAFGNSFLLDKNDRPGKICPSVDALCALIDEQLSQFTLLDEKTGLNTLTKTHGEHLDQKCCQRAHQAIEKLLSS